MNFDPNRSSNTPNSGPAPETTAPRTGLATILSTSTSNTPPPINTPIVSSTAPAQDLPTLKEANLKLWYFWARYFISNQFSPNQATITLISELLLTKSLEQIQPEDFLTAYLSVASGLKPQERDMLKNFYDIQLCPFMNEVHQIDPDEIIPQLVSILATDPLTDNTQWDSLEKLHTALLKFELPSLSSTRPKLSSPPSTNENITHSWSSNDITSLPTSTSSSAPSTRSAVLVAPEVPADKKANTHILDLIHPLADQLTENFPLLTYNLFYQQIAYHMPDNLLWNSDSLDATLLTLMMDNLKPDQISAMKLAGNACRKIPALFGESEEAIGLSLFLIRLSDLLGPNNL